jgi:bifunctional UDP-N-acetylglucosamine pyrophosphorylase / glucosamine-1-phosphate N-acetyltransferase
VTPKPDVAVVVLAAGQGTRMRSAKPKVLHDVAGKPILAHVLAAASVLAPERTVVVVGHGADEVRARCGLPGVEFALQSEQLGTGHAVLAAAEVLGPWGGTLLVLNGDAPLLTSESLARLLGAHHAGGEGMTLLTYEVDDPSGLGRVVRGADGRVERIVEERDTDAATRALREVSPGCYAFDPRVWGLLRSLGAGNAAGEYYLTDVVTAYLSAGLPVRAVLGDDESRLLVGVNDRAQLAEAERLLRDRTRRRWLEGGVTMQAPATTVIDDTVELGRDVELEPGVILRGRTRVGDGARIGAYAVIDDCTVAAGAQVAPLTVARGRRLD